MFTAKGDLLYKEGPDPKDYCFAGSFAETNLYGFVSVSDMSIHPEDSSGYLIKYIVGGDSRGPDELDADLGKFSGSFIEAEYYDEQSNLLGKKRVRTVDAQKDTRPIEGPKL